MGQPRPSSSRIAPVRLAMARWARSGSRPASQAMTASTANSGRVCSHARMASARPWEMRNCAASAPQATRNADRSMLGNVQSAASAAPPPCIAEASSFRNRTGVQNTMARDQMKSSSLHSFHESHAEPPPPAPPPPTEVRIPFQTLVHEMLEQLGEDPKREGLRQTPARMEASLKWLTRGYGMNVDEVIGDALFEETHESMICVRDIEIYSMCEHHMLPFFGRAHVAYLPNGRIVGLSKIPRVVEVFARRLQVQERLTDQVADALCRVLKPLGVGVVIEAYHLCMMMRGVEKQNSKTVTSALRGAFRDDAKTRDEFLRLVHGGNGLA